MLRGSELGQGFVWMSWRDVGCVCVIVVGIILFLYGANYYDAAIGWVGFFLTVVGLFAEVAFRVYERVKKRAFGQKP
jgi:hypothetical protein